MPHRTAPAPVAPGDGRGEAAATSSAGRWWPAAVLALAQLMVVLESTVVNIALPSAQADLGFSDAARQWVITGYALAFGSLLLLGGRLADYFGRRRLFMIGLAGFALASALGGAAQNVEVLIAARVLQGIFAAALAPAALSMLTTTFTEPADRARAFSIFGVTSAAGGAVGLLVGGLLTSYASWRWTLFINLGIAAVALFGAVTTLDGSARATRQPLDLPGVATAVVGLVAVVFGLSQAAGDGWSAPITYGPVFVGLLLLAVFLRIQARSSSPLLPLRILLDRNRGGAYVAIALASAGMYGVYLFLTYFLATTLGFSSLQCGLAILPMIGALVVSAARLSSQLIVQVGPRPLLPTGALIAAAGMALLTRIDLDTHYLTGVLPALLVIGLGLGLILPPSQNTATAAVRPADAGVGSAMITTMQQIGGAVGTALLSTVAATTLAGYTASHPGSAELAALASYHTAFWWCVGLFLLAAAVSAVLLRPGPLVLDPDALPPT